MSRYPALGRGGYDESLLQVAPQVTKADRQQGYNVDLLEQGGTSNFYGPQFGPDAPRPSPQQFTQGYEQPRSQQRQPPQQPASSNGHSSPPSLEKADYYTTGSVNQRDIYAVDTFTPPKKPWFRTKRGLAIIFLTLVLIAGAVVGIAVGITTSNDKANADKKGVQQGTRQGSGGAGAASSAEAGGQANTGSLPSLPSLSLVSLDSPGPVSLDLAQQPAATATAAAGVIPTINPTLAPSAALQTVPGATTPSRITRTTPAIAAPTQSVNPICQQFPSLPACRR